MSLWWLLQRTAIHPLWKLLPFGKSILFCYAIETHSTTQIEGSKIFQRVMGSSKTDSTKSVWLELYFSEKEKVEMSWKSERHKKWVLVWKKVFQFFLILIAKTLTTSVTNAHFGNVSFIGIEIESMLLFYNTFLFFSILCFFFSQTFFTHSSKE